MFIMSFNFRHNLFYVFNLLRMRILCLFFEYKILFIYYIHIFLYYTFIHFIVYIKFIYSIYINIYLSKKIENKK